MIDDLPSSGVVLSDLLDVNAARQPDVEAITDGTTRLSWSDYRDRAATLAGALAESGVARGDRVGVHLPKSVGSFVAVHAILRLGAIVVPVDWFAPSAYARELITDADVTAIVSSAGDKALDELFEGRTARPAVVVPDAAGPAADVASVTASDDAYIVYTSGSTGRPKGIVHTHASALAYASAAVETYGLGQHDRLANFAPLHFDQSTFELYAAPLAGAGVLVLSDVVLRFPASASELLARERVTVWYTVPYAIAQLTSRGAVADRDLSALRWVLFGGESFQPGALRSSMEALPGVRFSNVYGPAEVNQCTFHHLEEPPPDDSPVPIGRAWPVAELLIVAGDDTHIDDDSPGELLVASDTMMNRYWNRPDLTDAGIVTRSDGGADRRWYRTGDLVTRRDDGLLVFLGRVDHQVKLRGHRIEIEAVESVACEHALVSDCAVVVERGDEDHLIAVVTPLLDPESSASVLDHLRRRLPRYSLPNEVISVAVIPRSGTGKIDRPAVARALLDQREIDPSPATQTIIDC